MIFIMAIVFILVRKQGGGRGVTVEILKKNISNFDNTSNERRFDIKCSENKMKLLYSFNQR